MTTSRKATSVKAQPAIDETFIPEPVAEDPDPFEEEVQAPKGRALPFQNPASMPKNLLVERAIAKKASSSERSELERRIRALHAEPNTRRRNAASNPQARVYPSDSKRSMDLWRFARDTQATVNDPSLLQELIDHNVGNQPHMAAFSTLDLDFLARGFAHPGEQFRPWTRGLKAISERFGTYGTVEATYNGFDLVLTETPEGTYTLGSAELYDLLVQARDVQPAPYTSLCVMGGTTRAPQNGRAPIPGWDGYTMVIPAGTEFIARSESEPVSFEVDIRLSMPFQIAAWFLYSVGLDMSQEMGEAQKAAISLRLAILNKYLGGALPQDKDHLNWVDSIYAYMRAARGHENEIFEPGRRLAGMNRAILGNFDDFLVVWRTLEAERDARAQEREVARATRREQAATRANQQSDPTITVDVVDPFEGEMLP